MTLQYFKITSKSLSLSKKKKKKKKKWNVQDDSLITNISNRLSTSLVDVGYREMTELTFLRCGAKYQNV